MHELGKIHLDFSRKRVFLDVEELARFVVTGVVATVGNLSIVWLTQSALGLEAALAIGICTGLAISFVMSKLYAFRSHSWEEAHLETMRFLTVYAFGAAINWTIGYTAGHYLLPAFMPAKVAGLVAALLGLVPWPLPATSAIVSIRTRQAMGRLGTFGYRSAIMSAP